MTVSNVTYQVGDLFTTQKSNITGRIKEITPVTASMTRVLLETEQGDRYTTVTL
jgi:hypothetical protein